MNLTIIAQTMRRQLAYRPQGACKRLLFGGLVVTLHRNGDTWRLAIGREASPPSKTETEVIARDFGLPAGIEWNWTQKEQKRVVKGKRSVSVYITNWNAAECRWIEREAVKSNG